MANLLNEAAVEVRNMAKVGLSNLKTALGSQRDFEALIGRYINNEKQFEKIKQMLKKTDIESISSSAATR
jgi:predicted component of type VI protein secretion system